MTSRLQEFIERENSIRYKLSVANSVKEKNPSLHDKLVNEARQEHRKLGIDFGITS